MPDSVSVDAPTSARKHAPKGRAWLWGAAALVAGALLGRALVVEGALWLASGWASWLGAPAAPVAALEAAQDEDAGGELQEGELEGIESEPREGHPRGSEQQPGAPRRTQGPPHITTVRVGAGQVLAWANAGVVPSGRAVSARGGCPDGIQLRGVGALGLGLRDGDLLTRVEGVPVRERGQVVSAVLAARGRREATLDALVLRPGAGCRVGAHVVVEQPYPTEEQLRQTLSASERADDTRPEQALTPAASPLERAESSAPR